MSKDTPNLIVPSRMVFFMWLVYVVNAIIPIDLTDFGILPRNLWGLIGIFTAPYLHGSLQHLISNTIPLLILGGTLYFFYPPIASTVFYGSYFLTNILVWLLARPNIHIGASGLIYAFAAFLVTFGIVRKDAKSIIISIITVLLYGGMIYGVLPGKYWVSWESHLFGALTGIFIAIGLGSKKRKAY